MQATEEQPVDDQESDSKATQKPEEEEESIKNAKIKVEAVRVQMANLIDQFFEAKMDKVR